MLKYFSSSKTIFSIKFYLKNKNSSGKILMPTDQVKTRFQEESCVYEVKD